MTVNGVSITPPKVYTGPGLSLRRAGLFLQLATRLGLTVLWDGGQAPPPPAYLTRPGGGHLAVLVVGVPMLCFSSLPKQYLLTQDTCRKYRVIERRDENKSPDIPPPKPKQLVF